MAVRVLNSDHILDLTELPSHLVILGAGAIGVEFASVFSRLGSKVTLVEFMDTILPLEDEEIGVELAKIFKQDLQDGRAHQDQDHPHREAGGRRGVLPRRRDPRRGGGQPPAGGRGPRAHGGGHRPGEATKAQVDRGCVVIDKFMQTGEPGLYAIGDIVRTPWLAHVASDEGIVAAEHAAQSLGKDVHPHPVRYDRFPACTYCDPEVGTIGLNEKAAKAKGYDVQVGTFPFAPMAKANIVGEPHGFIKIVADKQYGEILGIHILGPKATELVASSVALMGGEFTVDELIHTMYPHPSLNEVFPEAARAVYGRALNM